MKKVFLFKAHLVAVLTVTLCIHSSIWAQSATNSTQAAVTNYLTQLEPLQNATFISTPDQDHKPLIDAFNRATTSIKIGIFGISDKNIAESLSQAQKRGVSVTILCDNYCINSPSRSAIIDQLKANGVTVYLTSAAFSISHWKMFVVDDKLAFISTMNFIVMSDKMRDMGVFITNPSIVAEILAVFNTDIENSKNQTALTPALTQPNLVWSPVNSEQKLTDLINSAQESIEIWIENMGDQTIHQALKTAISRKVNVRLLTSLCSMGMPATMSFVNLKQLSGFGIQVKAMPFPATSDVPYIHAKSITVDHKTIFIGSENFSANSLLKSRELGLIFQDPDISKTMSGLYEKDWSAAVTLPEQAPDKCNALNVAPAPN